MGKNGKVVGFPKLICAGRTGYYKYAIMQLVGNDLGRLRRAMPEKKFTPSTSVLVALQTLNRIETLHDLGWLCRDVKSPNFAIGRGNDVGTVFMLDFGFARRYKYVSLSITTNKHYIFSEILPEICYPLAVLQLCLEQFTMLLSTLTTTKNNAVKMTSVSTIIIYVY